MANSLISMIKGDSTLINNTEVLDGQVLFNTDEKTILLDDDNTRTKYCGADKSNKNLAPIENGNTATRGYAAGSYVVWKEQLYKVLTQINSGTAFVVGTNIALDTVGAELTQINNDLSDKVSKTGDTISGNLSISGNLTVQNIDAFLHNKVSGINVAWKYCPLATDGWYYYEGANVTTYDLPFAHCIIQVYKANSIRGVAIAYRWDDGCPMTWINTLHDTWKGWKSIGSNYITLKAAATYSSPTIVTLHETMLNYSKLAFNLLEDDQVVDYMEVPVQRFQAGNYFVLHSKQTANSYALIVRHPENMNNEVNIAAIGGSPTIEIQGIY